MEEPYNHKFTSILFLTIFQAMEHLQSFITDCDRRTESAKKRLAETQEELSAEVAAKANKVHDLAEQIGKKLARAESLGADGMVEVRNEFVSIVGNPGTARVLKKTCH